MSSIVLGVGNGKALFTGTSVVPDEDLVRFADPTDSIINAFDLSVLRGDHRMEGFPGLVGESSQASCAIRKAYGHARAEHSGADPRRGAGHRPI